eukprot:comp21748_c0_seq1/m.48590 comp21748_c0_seq1/g.48590  ORF comp21748_c0_seq1/g.48590 comp21748_c0_seq1/m.48590 type:complete len:359 (+) comp21748_c0_seq1:14-1090(+)
MASVASPSRPAVKESTKCTTCGTSFGIFTHKYDCKHCGRLFCNSCSSKKHVLPDALGYKEEQRVCGDCYFNLRELHLSANQDDPTLIPDPRFFELEADLMERVSALLSVPEESWKRECFDKRVTISSRDMENSEIHCIRSKVAIPLHPAKVFEIYTSKELWKHWNPELIECRQITSSGDLSEILYLGYKFPVIDNRDAIVYSMTKPGLLNDPLKKDTFHIMATSIQHKLAPKQKKFVRCHIGLSYTTFVPIENPANKNEIFTGFTSIVHMDPAGKVPPMLVNQTIAKACDQIAMMREYMVKNPETGDKSVRLKIEEFTAKIQQNLVENPNYVSPPDPPLDQTKQTENPAPPQTQENTQ